MTRVGVGTLLVVLGTWALGWWAVPVVGALMGAIWPDRRPGIAAAAAGMLGWVALLVWGSTIGPVGNLADTVGGVMALPGAAVLLITLLFPAVLAGAAGALSAALRGGKGA